MMRGKLEAEKLKNLVLPYLGASNDNILVSPSIGEDAAVIDLGMTKLVAASDPITGALNSIGMYAVNVNANDIACTGAPPEYFLSVILLPEKYTDDDIRRIASDISREAQKLNVSIIGGHTEALPIEDPIIVGTMIGFTEKVVSTSGAHMGDDILLTKGAAIEGTSILATDFHDFLKNSVDEKTLKKAQKYLEKISIVKEALIAREYATAMHDPTEGGIAGALHELADASHCGFYVDVKKIPVSSETERICSLLSVNPLNLISSGSLLITAPKEASSTLQKALRKSGIVAEIIGEITKERNLEPVKQDELWRILDELK
ncbi:MAG: AIR synthase family protein [Theionarchaea archaeon]|nr:AIR synthase family protein [Theionarchaea archaeon]